MKQVVYIKCKPNVLKLFQTFESGWKLSILLAKVYKLCMWFVSYYSTPWQGCKTRGTFSLKRPEANDVLNDLNNYYMFI